MANFYALTAENCWRGCRDDTDFAESPQTVQNAIPGRVERWHVREGQLVHKGDTLPVTLVRHSFTTDCGISTA